MSREYGWNLCLLRRADLHASEEVAKILHINSVDVIVGGIYLFRELFVGFSIVFVESHYSPSV